MDEQWSQHKRDVAALIHSITNTKNDADAAKAIQNINACLDQCYKLLENNAGAGGPMVEEIKGAIIDLKVERALVRRQCPKSCGGDCAAADTADAGPKKKPHGYRIRKETSRFARFTGRQIKTYFYIICTG